MIAFLHTHIDCCSFIVSCQIDLAFVEEEYELELIDPILNERPIVCLLFVCHNDCPPYHIIPHQIEHGRKCIRPSLFSKSQERILRECQLVVPHDTISILFQSYTPSLSSFSTLCNPRIIVPDGDISPTQTDATNLQLRLKQPPHKVC